PARVCHRPRTEVKGSRPKVRPMATPASHAPRSRSTPRRDRASDAIIRRIKRQIAEGRLAEGHKLPAEREMARRVKTSRVSVREAYRALEELGVLRIRRGAEGGAFIALLDHQPVLRSLSLM